MQSEIYQLFVEVKYTMTYCQCEYRLDSIYFYGWCTLIEAPNHSRFCRLVRFVLMGHLFFCCFLGFLYMQLVYLGATLIYLFCFPIIIIVIII